jgi:hypothetical protein
MLVNPLFRIHSLIACQVPANLYACAVKATSQHGAMLAPIRLTNATASLPLRGQVRRKEKHPLPTSAPPPPPTRSHSLPRKYCFIVFHCASCYPARMAPGRYPHSCEAYWMPVNALEVDFQVPPRLIYVLYTLLTWSNVLDTIRSAFKTIRKDTHAKSA